MRIENKALQSESSNVLATHRFEIPEAMHGKIFKMYCSKQYTNKPLAVLREYACNAADAHVDAGKPDLPIRVIVPNRLESAVIIRDYGLGLSEQDIIGIYTQIGVTTKDQSDDMVGAFGVGALAGYGYDESGCFTITSWYDGMKTVYQAVVTDDGAALQKLAEIPCGDETGVQIKVPVRSEDYQRFRDEAMDLFSWWTPRPDINLGVPDLRNDGSALVFDKGAFFKDSHRGLATPWVAIMGCVPYAIDTGRCGVNFEALGLSTTARGALFFDIGDVDIVPSRESLEYTDRTRAAVTKAFEDLMEEASAGMLAGLQALGDNDLALRYEVKKQHDKAGFVPKAYRKYLNAPQHPYLPGKDVPGCFAVSSLHKDHSTRPKRLYTKGSSTVDRFYADDFRPTSSVFYINDTLYTDLSGFHETFSDGPRRYLIVPSYDKAAHRKEAKAARKAGQVAPPPPPEASLDEALASFEEWCTRNMCRGAKVVRLSTVKYVPWTRPKAEVNPKHRRKTFRWLDKCYRSSKDSDNWELVSDVPTVPCIHMPIYRFQPEGVEGVNNLHALEKVKGLVENAGGKFPEVYGFKTTAKKPITQADLPGKSLMAWIQGFLAAEIDLSVKLPPRKGSLKVPMDDYGRLNAARKVVKGNPLMADLVAQAEAFKAQEAVNEGLRQKVDKKYRVNGPLHTLAERFGTPAQKGVFAQAKGPQLDLAGIWDWHYPLIGDLGWYNMATWREGKRQPSIDDYVAAMDLLRVANGPFLPSDLSTLPTGHPLNPNTNQTTPTKATTP